MGNVFPIFAVNYNLPLNENLIGNLFLGWTDGKIQNRSGQMNFPKNWMISNFQFSYIYLHKLQKKMISYQVYSEYPF